MASDTAEHLAGATASTPATEPSLARQDGEHAPGAAAPKAAAPEAAPPAKPDAGLPTATLKDLFNVVADDFAQVNTLIPAELSSTVPMVEEIGHHIVESGGKRLRPLIALLTARACGYPHEACDGSGEPTRPRARDASNADTDARDDSSSDAADAATMQPSANTGHIRLAAIIEFLHTAMLLHDDVVDASTLRRGRATANALWGNSPSILVGDFLYSRAFQLMVQLNNMRIMAIISDATNEIAEGEVMQLAQVGNHRITEAEYLEVIRRKTAMLFQAAAHTGAVLATNDTALVDAFRRFGLHFGIAYQLIDDGLDYAGDSAVMGKNIGDDLAEGKMTLPLIHALQHGTGADAELITESIREKSDARLKDVIAAVRRTGGLDYTRERAVEEAELAVRELRGVPEGEYRDALEALTGVAVARIS